MPEHLKQEIKTGYYPICEEFCEICRCTKGKELNEKFTLLRQNLISWCVTIGGVSLVSVAILMFLFFILNTK